MEASQRDMVAHSNPCHKDAEHARMNHGIFQTNRGDVSVETTESVTIRHQKSRE
jgi:hypothetical protein